MYGIAFVIFLLYMGILFLSRNVQVSRKGLYKPFDKIATFLVLLFEKLFGENKRKTHLMSRLEQLFPGENPEKVQQDYIIRKLSLSLMVLFCGTILAMALHYTNSQESEDYSEGYVKRSDYLGESQEISLNVSSGEFDGEVTVKVEPQTLTRDEAEALLTDFFIALEKAMLGDNSSSQCVNENINPVKNVEGYPFSVEWASSDTGLIAAGSGLVTEVYETCQVEMVAYVSYSGYRWEKSFLLTVVPKEYEGDEAKLLGIENALKDAEANDRSKEVFYLPEEYEGKRLHWSDQVKDISLWIWLGVLFVSILIYVMSDKDLAGKLEEKKKKMKRIYPEIASKMVLYLGAGMTIRGVFQKIAEDAVNGENNNPIFTEMIFTCRELRSGIPESEAYERFGRRTGLQEYIRLSTLLQQNLKKGSSGMLLRLREEADNSSIERLQNCRRVGEEATTKLLLPMVMMLLVVMVMIMLPAFSSMNL